MKSQMNYVAILVCAVMHAMFGALWYGGIWSGPWMAMNGISAAQAQMGGSSISYVYSIIQSLIMAMFIGWLLGRLRIRTLAGGAQIALTVGFSTIFVAFVTNYSFSGRPMRLALIDAVCPMLSLTIMGGILGAWRTKSQKAMDALQRA